MKDYLQKIIDGIFSGKITKSNINSFMGFLGRHKIKHQINELIKDPIKLSEKAFRILNDINHNPVCRCGNVLKYINFYTGYSKICGKCSRSIKYNKEKAKIKRKKTLKIKYGVTNISKLESIKEKKKITKKKRYNDQNYNNIKKIKSTCQERYGVSNPNKLKSIRDKIDQTNIKKYGAKAYICSEKFIEKRREKIRLNSFNNIIRSNRFKEFGIEPLINFNEFSKFGLNEIYKWKCLQCDNIFKSNYHTHLPKCPKCKRKRSTSEYNILEWTKTLGFKIISNDRSLIYPQELDIIIPEKKIAIEFNGLYWHSELNGKDRKYHLNKTELCRKKGYQLIHIFEDEWLDKQEIVKSILKAKLGLFDKRIYARSCKISSVDSITSKEFLEKNHIQGPINSSVNYGLYYSEELVSIICLSTPRYNKNHKWELLRFCSKLNTQIVGGMSKLIKYFENNHNGSIISYCDLRYSNAKGYMNSGWNLINKTSPNYWYIKNNKRYSRMKFQKHKIKNVNPSLTEWQNMQLKGYDRIWDCGNFVFINNNVSGIKAVR